MQQVKKSAAGRQSVGEDSRRPAAERRPVNANVRRTGPARPDAQEHKRPTGAATTAKPSAKPADSDVVAKAVGKSKKKEKHEGSISFWMPHGRVDVPMLVITLVLLTFGITMMFSAGHAWAYEKNGDSFYYIMHQLPAAGLGLVGCFLLTLFDYRFLRVEIKVGKKKTGISLASVLLVAMIALNLLTIPFGVSNIEGGPRRWLKISVFGTFQPSDFLKIAVIIFLAAYIHKHSDRIRSFTVGLLNPGVLLGVIVLLMLEQSHLSCLLIILFGMAAMLFMGGVNLKPALFLVPLAALAIYFVFKNSEYSYYFDRITYMDPLSDPGNMSYQNYQSALAVGSGGLWGKGFGNSSQKYYYLPEAPNDFVYAILVEEFGLVGGIMVILMFLLFVLRGFQIARLAEDKFGCLLATGITFQIGLQALLNIGVNLCCIPNTGVSLPFFSYGGTALMIQLWEIGLLLSISKRADLK